MKMNFFNKSNYTLRHLYNIFTDTIELSVHKLVNLFLGIRHQSLKEFIFSQMWFFSRFLNAGKIEGAFLGWRILFW